MVLVGVADRSRGTATQGTVMTEFSQFQQYAEEAIQRAVQAKNEKEQFALKELARTWTQAANTSDHPVSVNYSPTDHHTAR
jgi:hypothetical protein